METETREKLIQDELKDYLSHEDVNKSCLAINCYLSPHRLSEQKLKNQIKKFRKNIEDGIPFRQASNSFLKSCNLSVKVSDKTTQKKKKEKFLFPTNFPPLHLETDEDRERFFNKMKGVLPSENKTLNYSLAISSINHRRYAQKPRGERPWKTTIRYIVEYLKETGGKVNKVNLETLLSVMEDELDIICYSRERPNPPLEITDVDRGNKIVHAQRRGDPNKKVEIPFDSIERYLRDIKK